MPGTIRWYVCPVVDWIASDAENGTFSLGRYPLVGTLTDPGTGHPYSTAQVYFPNGQKCLAYVRGITWTPIDNAAGCVNVLMRDYDDLTNILSTTPRSDGWTNARLNQVVTRVTNAGISVSGLTRDSTFRQILNTIGRQLHLSFDVDRTRTI